MNSIAQLEKQHLDLKIYKYLVDEIDEFTKEFAVNRSDIITEAISSYIAAQKENMFYESFDRSCKEAKRMIDENMPESSLEELINELKDNSNA